MSESGHEQQDNINKQRIESHNEKSDSPKPPLHPPVGIWEGKSPIGSITSPSESGKYRMVLRDYAATIQIEGSLVALDYSELGQDEQEVKKTILCQVSHTTSENTHHENHLLRALLREKGRIPGLSGYADHKEVDLLPMDTILTGKDVHQLPRNIPPMGTDVRFASQEDVNNFSGQHLALFNIGYLYETPVQVGLMLKHFGKGEDGWGDAHMLGVFGATGSGKTVMAASIVAGFAARREMGMLIVDPQGQFSGSELGKDRAIWTWSFNEAFRLVGRGLDVQFINISDIALESPRLFAELLDRYDFFDALSIMGHDKKSQMVTELTTYLSEWLRQNQNQNLGNLGWSQNITDVICGMGAATYSDPAKQAQKMLNAFQTAPYKLTKAENIWERVKKMFDRPHKLGDLLDNVLINRKIIILDVDAQESLKDLYCAEILDGIRSKAEAIARIKQGRPWRGDPGKYRNVETNALIVIDEAHRFAPQASGRNRDQERMVETLADAIRTTRKLGVGWFYITQSMAEFDKRIFRQIQTKILGVGLGTGADSDHLETAFNHDKQLIERYRSLPRPLTTKVFPFAVIGELVALGNGSRALFVSAFKDQQELFNLNRDHFKYPNGASVSSSTTSSSFQDAEQLPLQTNQLPPPEDLIDEIPF